MLKNKLDSIFKSYDIRGVYGDEITNDIASKIGFAFSEFVKDDEILIGHDGRLSNMEMLNAVVSGITLNNKKYIYVGLVPTDVVYSLSGLLKKPGVIITASHNPKEYNGFKIHSKKERFYGKDLIEFARFANSRASKRLPA